jgi:hypothetical protein
MSAYEVYHKSLRVLQQARVPFLVCGAYAFQAYTGLVRRTKDLDIALEKPDCARALAAFRKAGFRTQFTFRHWLAKAFHGDYFLDILFASGNGLCRVDGEWFRYAPAGRLFGLPVLLCPPEEMIWSKAFVMERERFDGADIAHLLRACGRTMDWDRLMRRFASHPRLLLAHLLLFGFVYPGDRDVVPARVMRLLWRRVQRERPARRRDCRGPLLSRAQYLVDIKRWGYRDPRLAPEGSMSAGEVAAWTRAMRARPHRVPVKALIGAPAAEPGRSRRGRPPAPYLLRPSFPR